MLKIDKEITDEHDDRLDRNDMVEKLAKSIINYPNNDTLTIGITGKWGVGKSSLINLTLNKIRENKNVIIIQFNPWFFSNQKNLYYQFFKLLLITFKDLEINRKSIFERKTKPHRGIFKRFEIDTIKDYFNFIDNSSFNLNNNEFYSINSQDLESYESLESLKDRCNNYFQNLGCKIIVVIDDIDRLLDDEIRQIFTLVKSLANFNNFIYILSFDKVIVSRALKEFHSDYEGKFIEKIVPILIRVPDITESRLSNLIDEDIKPLYLDHLKENYINENNNFEELSKYLSYFIDNIRDLKRYTNMLNFYLDEFIYDINLDDYFLILALQLFEYEVYLSLKRNKRILTSKIDIDERDENNRLNLFYKELDEIKCDISLNDLKYVLKYLFPILKYHKNKNPPSKSFYEYFHSKHKVGSRTHFSKYFTLSLEDVEVSTKTLTQLINSTNKNNILNIFSSRYNKLHNQSLFDEFLYVAKKIPKENSELILYRLFKIGDDLNLYNHSRSDMNRSINILFKNLDDSVRAFEIFEDCINFKNNIFTLSDYLYKIKIDILENNISINDLIFSEEELNQLYELVCKKIRKSSEDGSLLNHRFVSTILVHWKAFEKDKTIVENYVHEKTEDDYVLIEFLKKYNASDVEDSESMVTFGFDSSRTHYFESLEKEYFKDLEGLNTRVERILNDENTSGDHKDFCEKFIRAFEEFKKSSYDFQNKLISK